MNARVGFVAGMLVLASGCGAARAPEATRATTAAVRDSLSDRMNAAKLGDTLAAILQAGVRDSAFPGAVALVGTKNGVAVLSSAGSLDWNEVTPPGPATLWDLASLTKVVGLTSAMMLLVESRQVDLDAPVSRYIPEFQGKWKDAVTLRRLLTHSSGLPAWRPLYKEAESPAAALALAIATPLDTMPGVRMVYSDLGVIIAGDIVARVTGQPLDAFLKARVFGPLTMWDTQYNPDRSLRGRIAPTEVDPWRQRHLRGEVHDENAFALGGVSGHAGLFSTGNDLVQLVRMYLEDGDILMLRSNLPRPDEVVRSRFVSPATIRQFTTVQDSALSHRALGWETPNGTNSAGHLMSRRAFGHTGFTGTSIWIDPERGIFVVLLSNRVNPTREHRAITGVRVAVADAVMRAVLR
jgi:CubicO group peptidase (beta-lactamase class C family)